MCIWQASPRGPALQSLSSAGPCSEAALRTGRYTSTVSVFTTVLDSVLGSLWHFGERVTSLYFRSKPTRTIQSNTCAEQKLIHHNNCIGGTTVNTQCIAAQHPAPWYNRDTANLAPTGMQQCKSLYIEVLRRSVGRPRMHATCGIFWRRRAGTGIKKTRRADVFAQGNPGMSACVQSCH